MPDDWRDKLALLIGTDALVEESAPASEHTFTPHYDESIRANATPPETTIKDLVLGLERDEMIEMQTKALDAVLKNTGRTIRHPHETHAERQARLRGIPAIGSVGGAIKGTRPDHA